MSHHSKVNPARRILVLSGYDAASHRYWVAGLQQMLPNSEFTVLSLPARYFSWRVRGSSLSFATLYREQLEGDYDLLVATSMVDLASLRGMVPKLASLPNLMYVHENQFAYPDNRGPGQLVDIQLTQIYGLMTADRICFNSAYNRESYRAGAKALFRRLPDHAKPSQIDEVLSKSTVLPVALLRECHEVRANPSDNKLQLVWNHRWEYDKAPERLLLLIEELIRRKQAFTMHVVGQRFRSSPKVFDDIRRRLVDVDALGVWGFVEREQDYLQLLSQCDYVISTALHDFQGVAVLEAVAMGCYPIVPDRLAYPEWFGTLCHKQSLEDAEGEARYAVEAILATKQSVPNISSLHYAQLAEQYRYHFRTAS